MKRYKPASDFVIRKVSDHTFAIPLARELGSNSFSYSLSETATRIYELALDRKSEEEIASHFLENYEIENREDLKKDVAQCIASLLEAKLIEELAK